MTSPPSPPAFPLSSSPATYLNALRTYFRYTCLRPNQEPVVSAVLNNSDVLLTAPTGHGKSLCFQLPALVRHAAHPLGTLCLVVTPLLSLMHNQVAALRARNIPAQLLSSAEPPAANARVLASLKAQRLAFGLLYLTPERLVSPAFLDLLQPLYKANRLALVAIDEAHCISQWGHDFRPAYARLSTVKSNFPSTPLVALTATATPHVARDILAQLRIPGALRVHTSFLRSNIRYEVRYVDAMHVDPADDILRYIQARIQAASKRGMGGDDGAERGIVYAFKRDTVDMLARMLQEGGVPAVAYHAGLGSNKRKEAQELFESGERPVVVASTAFGMGIDVAAIRYVIHHSVPKSVEAFYQESGRAGRDGLPSESVLYYAERDAEFNAYLNSRASGKGDQGRLEAAVKAHEAMKAYCMEVKCRRVALLKYFGEDAEAGKVCGTQGCDVCGNRRDVIRRMHVKVVARGTGFTSASSLRGVTTPAADFQTARAMLKVAKEQEAQGEGELQKRRRGSLVHDEEIDHFSSGDEIDLKGKQALERLAVSRKPSAGLRALARAEEESVAVKNSRLKRPRDRLLSQLNGGAGSKPVASVSGKKQKSLLGYASFKKKRPAPK